MSVAVHAVHTVAQMPHAASVVAYGCGPVGVLTCAVAKGLGARKVIVVGKLPFGFYSSAKLRKAQNLNLIILMLSDVNEDRLKFAKEQGLVDDYYVSPKANEGESKMDYSRRSAEELCKRFGFDERGPGGIDLVVDCSGAEVCIQAGIFALKHGGTLINVSSEFYLLNLIYLQRKA
jgi:D-xylulose reductase